MVDIGACGRIEMVMATTRDSIVSAAAELLDQAGPDGVTLRAVAHLADLSHNAPYKHFQDKEALLAAVAAKELRARRAAMAAVLAKVADPLSALRRLTHDHIRWAMRYPHRFRLIFGRWDRHDDDLGEAAEATRRLFIESIAVVRRSGLIGPGDDEHTAALLMAAIHGAIDLAMDGHLAADGKGRSDPRDLIDDLIDLLQLRPGDSGAVPRRARSSRD